MDIGVESIAETEDMAAASVQFNRKLDDFLDDMGVSHPHVREFTLLQKSLALIAQVDPEQPMALLKRFVAQPYGDAIRGRDEAFLLSEKFTTPSSPQQTDVVSLLKGVWMDMDADNQDAVWRHLQTLVVLSIAYDEKN